MIINYENNISFDSEYLTYFKSDELHIYTESTKTPLAKFIKSDAITLTYMSEEKCNLKCKYCFEFYDVKRKRQSFTFENYKKYYDKIKKEKVVDGIVFFGGEALLNYREIKKFVNYVREKDKKIEIVIGTNGTILNEEILKFIKINNIRITTSLDGTKKINDNARYGANIDSVYDTVTSNLKKLREKGVGVAVQFTINRGHLDNDYLQEIKEIFILMNDLRIYNYVITFVETENEEFKVDSQDAGHVKKVREINDLIADFTFNSIMEANSTVPSNFISLWSSLLRREKAELCAAGYSMSVRNDGSLFACHMFVGDGKGVQFNKLSSFDEDNEIKRIRNLSPHSLPTCQECPAKNICSTWCKAMGDGEELKLQFSRCLQANLAIEKFAEKFYTMNEDDKAKFVKNLINYSKRYTGLYNE